MGPEPASIRPCVRPCVCVFTHLNMNISMTSWPIAIKFYLKHKWGGEKASLRFGADQIRTLVFMATDSSNRVIMGKTASSRFLSCFCIKTFSYLQVRMSYITFSLLFSFGSYHTCR